MCACVCVVNLWTFVSNNDNIFADCIFLHDVMYSLHVVHCELCEVLKAHTVGNGEL